MGAHGERKTLIMGRRPPGPQMPGSATDAVKEPKFCYVVAILNSSLSLK